LIPLDPADAARTPRNPRGEAALVSHNTGPVELKDVRPRVLWVDDDASLNRVAERLLPRAGFDLTIAVDEASAMHAAASGEHDAILLDQRLPGSPDLEVLRRLRRAGDRTPVVVLTGHESLEAATEALTLGVVDYLVKPARNERILAALRIAVRAGSCEPLRDPPAIVLQSDASIALLSILCNLRVADEAQLRTQLAWAVADEGLSFPERVAAVEALGQMFAPASDAERRRQVAAWLRRGLALSPERFSPVVGNFVRLITAESARVRHLKGDPLAQEVGASMGELSRLVHLELGVSPDRCRLITYLSPALQELAHSNEQVAQIGYHLGQNTHSGFDNVFHKLWGVYPTEYRAVLTGDSPAADGPRPGQ
jgi:CheY-like chemotaxis protein/AraC-like DNA-binding protein